MTSVTTNYKDPEEIQEWRLLPIQTNDAFTNMAIDEAILWHRRDNKVPDTFRLYRWQPSAVSIGCFQGINLEVNLDACKTRGFDVVRRITGGGAVFHSYEGEVTYSFITPEINPKIPKNILESYGVICQGVVEACAELGLTGAQFKPVNDVQYKDRKISGNAQTRKQHMVLQHGTVLVGFDPIIMFEVLKVSKEKISDKLIQSVHKRVTSISTELNRQVSPKETADALILGFEKALGIKLIPGELTSSELELANQIRKDRFSSRDWNYQR